VVFLIAWEIAGRAKWFSPLVLPVPSNVFHALVNEVGDGRFWRNWGQTASVWAPSWILGMAMGLGLGFVASVSATATRLVWPLASCLRALPPITLFPVALILLRPGALPAFVVATVGGALYVFPTVHEAAVENASRFNALATMLGFNRAGFLRHFVAPGALLQTLAASRVAAAYAFAVTVAGEMILGGRSGVGAAILDFSERLKLEQAYAYIISAAVIGLVIDAIVARLSVTWRLRLGVERRGHT
jgi:NitT/TauT family transport system permease protein